MIYWQLCKQMGYPGMSCIYYSFIIQLNVTVHVALEHKPNFELGECNIRKFFSTALSGMCMDGDKVGDTSKHRNMILMQFVSITMYVSMSCQLGYSITTSAICSFNPSPVVSDIIQHILQTCPEIILSIKFMSLLWLIYNYGLFHLIAIKSKCYHTRHDPLAHIMK